MRAPEPGAPNTPPARQAPRAWSPRQACWLLGKEIADLAPEEQAYRAALLDRAPDVCIALAQVQRFQRLIRERDEAEFVSCLRETA